MAVLKSPRPLEESNLIIAVSISPECPIEAWHGGQDSLVPTVLRLVGIVEPAGVFDCNFISLLRLLAAVARLDELLLHTHGEELVVGKEEVGLVACWDGQCRLKAAVSRGKWCSVVSSADEEYLGWWKWSRGEQELFKLSEGGTLRRRKVVVQYR